MQKRKTSKARARESKQPHNACCTKHDHLSGYIDGEISECVQKQIEQHFADCPGCRLTVKDLRRMIKACRAEKMMKVPTAKHRKLVKLIYGKI
jgi:anti-sigma factor RsiW